MNLPDTITKLKQNVVCTECSCFCDDISIKVDANSIVSVENACQIGEAFFLFNHQLPVWKAKVNDKDESIEQGIKCAANVLSKSINPLILGIENCSTEAQQVACRLAAHVGGILDTGMSQWNKNSIDALQNTGEVTCSFGEIKNRTDLYVYWGANPVENQPRHFERIGSDSNGRFINKYNRRRIVVIDEIATDTVKRADRFIQLPREYNLSALLTLRAICNDVQVAADNTDLPPGVNSPQWNELFDEIVSSKHATFFVGESFGSDNTGALLFEAINKLVLDLNKHTRTFVQSVAGNRNSTGAESVLSWFAGFPSAVRFQNKNTEYFGEEYSAELALSAKEVDAVIAIGNTTFTSLSQSARSHINSIPLIVIETLPENQFSQLVPFVRLNAKKMTKEEKGTVYRNDHVPLPMSEVVNSENPDAASILQSIISLI